MSSSTKIEWATKTWNPMAGCAHVSPGCDNCYAARQTSGRLKHHPLYTGLAEGGRFTGEVRLAPARLADPLAWQRHERVFVNSMSDLFHDDVPDEFIARVFAVMAQAPRHTFQVLTKRPGRMASLLSADAFRLAVAEAFGFAYAARITQGRIASGLPEGEFNRLDRAELGDRYPDRVGRSAVEHALDVVLARLGPWPLPNVWLGTSVESQKWADVRVPQLMRTPAAVRFLSCEPLLGPVHLDPSWLTPEATMCGPRPRNDEGRRAVLEVVKATGRMLGWSGVDWVIVGGESGPKARPMHPGWVRSLRDQCQAADVAFFFKQWGEWRLFQADDDPTKGLLWDGTGADPLISIIRVGKKAAGRELDGRSWDDYPAGEAVPA